MVGNWSAVMGLALVFHDGGMGALGVPYTQVCHFLLPELVH